MVNPTKVSCILDNGKAEIIAPVSIGAGLVSTELSLNAIGIEVLIEEIMDKILANIRTLFAPCDPVHVQKVPYRNIIRRYVLAPRSTSKHQRRSKPVIRTAHRALRGRRIHQDPSGVYG